MKAHPPRPAEPVNALPCVVSVGFAGPRHLFDSHARSDETEQQVLAHLGQRLLGLHGDLALSRFHFLCGISQIAVGADTLFTRACGSLDILQRVFLPQPRDAYLEANGSDGTPDFSPDERRIAVALLDSPHVIQHLVVSDAPDRASRFEDTNREILLASQVIVCLVRDGRERRVGGTRDLLDLAKDRGVPVLEIRVASRDGQLVCEEQWHGRELFVPPTLPHVIEALDASAVSVPGSPPSVDGFCQVVKRHVSTQAQRHSERFSRAAFTIIGMHILATLLAALALAVHRAEASPSTAMVAPAHAPSFWIAALLVAELVALLLGLGVHKWLHRVHPSKLWALSRLLAEINRSVSALGKLPLDLGYLFQLRLPSELNSLLRTLNVLHLQSTRPFTNEPWEGIRDAYVSERLDHPDERLGQITYYDRRRSSEHGRLTRASRLFETCSILAMIATATKLVVLLRVVRLMPAWERIVTAGLGAAAIVLPVLAVGALSWVAAKDYEARVSIYGDMVRFLKEQQRRLKQTVSPREFRALVEETEFHLLGETAEWYSRRTFTGVA